MIEAYIQCPNMIIFGLPNLSSSEKIVLIALIGLVWGDEKPHPISIRALAKIIHLSSAALCDSAKSAEEKQKQQEQGKFREGILTRLASCGYITVEYLTNERGKHSQVVITVHLRKIWEDNSAFKKEQGVYNLNTISPKGAYKLSTSAYNLNTSVQKLNTPSSQNGSTRSVEAPYKTKEESIQEENKKASPVKIAHVRMALQEPLRKLSGVVEPNSVYEQRVLSLAQRAGITPAVFRQKAKSALTTTVAMSGDIEYFIGCLERACVR